MLYNTFLRFKLHFSMLFFRNISEVCYIKWGRKGFFLMGGQMGVVGLPAFLSQAALLWCLRTSQLVTDGVALGPSWLNKFIDCNGFKPPPASRLQASCPTLALPWWVWIKFVRQCTILPPLLLSEGNPVWVALHAIAPLVSVTAFPPGTAGDQGFYLPSTWCVPPDSQSPLQGGIAVTIKWVKKKDPWIANQDGFTTVHSMDCSWRCGSRPVDKKS